jgi:hypothetical protein
MFNRMISLTMATMTALPTFAQDKMSSDKMAGAKMSDGNMAGGKMASSVERGGRNKICPSPPLRNGAEERGGCRPG